MLSYIKHLPSSLSAFDSYLPLTRYWPLGFVGLGIFSLILACGRWLELKLDKPGKDIAGFISVAALFQIGIILMFYREPLY